MNTSNNKNTNSKSNTNNTTTAFCALGALVCFCICFDYRINFLLPCAHKLNDVKTINASMAHWD
jgi:hypothetical protein